MLLNGYLMHNMGIHIHIFKGNGGRKAIQSLFKSDAFLHLSGVITKQFSTSFQLHHKEKLHKNKLQGKIYSNLQLHPCLVLPSLMPLHFMS